MVQVPLRAAAERDSARRWPPSEKTGRAKLSPSRLAAPFLPRLGFAAGYHRTSHDPSNNQWQRDLSVSQHRRRAAGEGGPCGGAHCLSGRLTAYQAGLEIREEPARRDPSNRDPRGAGLGRTGWGGQQLNLKDQPHAPATKATSKWGLRDPPQQDRVGLPKALTRTANPQKVRLISTLVLYGRLWCSFGTSGR
jgi:hypothetical protein